MESRRDIFEKGRRYRVIADWDMTLDKPYHLRVGELVVFCQYFHSFYDGLSDYLFRTDSGEERHWCLDDSKPGEEWKTYFEIVDETNAA